MDRLYPLLASSVIVSAEPLAQHGQAWGGGFPWEELRRPVTPGGHLRAEPRACFSQAGGRTDTASGKPEEPVSRPSGTKLESAPTHRGEVLKARMVPPGLA